MEGEDHPKACTGRKLLRRGLARNFAGRRGSTGAPILLDPHAPVPLSLSDLPRARRGGLLGVDCSWNRVAVRGSLPPRAAFGERGSVRRRLPYLFAANPQHYGRLAELNTAEALAASLWILGERARAEEILSSFPGGSTLLTLNATALSRYGSCQGPEQIEAVERELF
jgi:pre-rRNA-processing protein TSR3